MEHNNRRNDDDGDDDDDDDESDDDDDVDDDDDDDGPWVHYGNGQVGIQYYNRQLYILRNGRRNECFIIYMVFETLEENQTTAKPNDNNNRGIIFLLLLIKFS